MGHQDHKYRVKPLEECHAWEILTWKYPPPYDFYNPPQDDRGASYVKQFINPELQFHAVIDQGENLIGYCSYGLDGQVPGGNYRDDALDIGIGMRPEFTGQGNGAEFFDAVLLHAMNTLNPEKVRLTVAKFNQRALKLYENFGFTVDDEFFDSSSKVAFSILTRVSE